MGKVWIPVTSTNQRQEMSWAAHELIQQNYLPTCPLCRQGELRFYYHEFGIVQLPRRRGTLWIWCNCCLHWDHFSGIELPENYIYDDPLYRTGLSDAENSGLLDTLNALWKRGVLPKHFHEAS
jgi:hypothetical protein